MCVRVLVWSLTVSMCVKQIGDKGDEDEDRSGEEESGGDAEDSQGGSSQVAFQRS